MNDNNDGWLGDLIIIIIMIVIAGMTMHYLDKVSDDTSNDTVVEIVEVEEKESDVNPIQTDVIRCEPMTEEQIAEEEYYDSQ